MVVKIRLWEAHNLQQAWSGVFIAPLIMLLAEIELNQGLA